MVIIFLHCKLDTMVHENAIMNTFIHVLSRRNYLQIPFSLSFVCIYSLHLLLALLFMIHIFVTFYLVVYAYIYYYPRHFYRGCSMRIICIICLAKNSQILTNFLMDMNVRNNCDFIIPLNIGIVIMFYVYCTVMS